MVVVPSRDWVGAGFSKYVERLCGLGRLARLVVVEADRLCHSATVAPVVSTLRELVCQSTSIVLLTGICPPSIEERLFDSVSQTAHQVIRRPTDRLEVVHSVFGVDLFGSPSLEEASSPWISLTAADLDASERALAFSKTIEGCRIIAKRLGWMVYHSLNSDNDCNDSLEAWMHGRVQGLVCDTLSNLCLEGITVRYVFHIGTPENLATYAQSLSHLSHDGRPVFSVVFRDKSASNIHPSSSDIEQVFAVHQAPDPSCCRRLSIASRLDGMGMTCIALPNSQLCDVCNLLCKHASAEFGPAFAPTFPAAPPTCLMATNARRVEPPASGYIGQALISTSPSLTIEQVKYTANIATNDDPRYLLANACNALATSCVICWFNGSDHGHSQKFCSSWVLKSEQWDSWLRNFPKLPPDCCMFCGCPLSVRFLAMMSLSTPLMLSLQLMYALQPRQNIRVHNHSSDHTCTWNLVLRPLALVAHEPYFIRRLSMSGEQVDCDGYLAWLTMGDDDFGIKLMKLVMEWAEERERRERNERVIRSMISTTKERNRGVVGMSGVRPAIKGAR
ncbi:P-loop containing nucleoside triphosphate hydrolase protein [Salix suchowensis]|nr:P-loop containing nucleoside triphosphate hydrolase protein [Salix suchowensis]